MHSDVSVARTLHLKLGEVVLSSAVAGFHVGLWHAVVLRRKGVCGMAIIGWAIFGLIVGAIARLLIPGRQAMGLFMTMLLGIVGSVAGGMLSWLFVGGPDRPYEPAGWIMSVIGALLVVFIGTRFGGKSRPV